MLIQETSREAYKNRRMSVQKTMAFAFAFGWEGTDDEYEKASGLRHQTVSATRRGLVKAGAVKDSGQRRRTRSGRRAIVWTAA